MIIRKFSIIAALFSCAAVAQKWEVGVGAGGDFYTSQTVKGAISSADASLATAIAASAWVANNSGSLLGGELRYDYENSSLKLSSGATRATFAGQTHAVHYDFLLHFAPRNARIRPFVAAGAGIKIYRGTGSPSAFQSPLQDIAILTQTKDLKPLVSVGAGIKFAVTERIQLRVEVHDYLTPFPAKVITPMPNASVGGWLQDFVPMFGLSYTF